MKSLIETSIQHYPFDIQFAELIISSADYADTKIRIWFINDFDREFTPLIRHLLEYLWHYLQWYPQNMNRFVAWTVPSGKHQYCKEIMAGSPKKAS